MKKQLNHQESKFTNCKFPIILVLDNVTGEANIGSLFRLADAFNIQKMVFCGYPPNLKSNRLKRTSRNTHENIEFEVWEDTKDAVEHYREDGYPIYALEITSESVSIDSISYNEFSKLVLIVGNEAGGVSAEILNLSERSVHINMYGNNSSMNVAQAAGIALFEISKTIPPFNKK